MSSKSTQTGRLIEEYLSAQKITRKQFAQKLRLSPPYLSMLMNGDRRLTQSVVALLVKKTGIPATQWWQAGGIGPKDESTRSGTVLADWRIARSHRDGWLSIEPFRAEGEDGRLQAASYDLSRGDFTLADTDESRTTETLVLKHRQSALVYTREKITLSKHVIGRIAPQGELVAHFVTLSFGLQLDPGWEGQPFMHLMNQGRDPFVLEYDQPFASVEFHLLADEPESAWDPAKSRRAAEPLPPTALDLDERIRNLSKELEALRATRMGMGKS